MTLLAYWSIAWIIGIWLSSLLAVPLCVWAVAALVALLATVLTRPFSTRLLFSCVFLLALGGTRLALAQPRFGDHSLASHNNKGAVTLVGVVAAEPDVRDAFVFYKLDAENLLLDGNGGEPLVVHGAARVQGPRYPVFRYGDRLRVRGSLEEPPILEDLNYRKYLAIRGIHSQVPDAQIERVDSGAGVAWKRVMLDLKGRAQETIARILPEPEASLLTGILLGVESTIPRSLMEAFSRTGATHVIVISGFNITIVVALLTMAVGWIISDRRLTAAIAILGVVAYTVLVGADAAVVRAAMMGVVVVLGVAVGRKSIPYNALAFTVIVLTALNPFMLWDVGFQLSVAATIGLIVYGKRFEQFAQRVLEHKVSTERARWVVRCLSEIILLTVAAQIMTMPLILKHFGLLSVVSFLTNALILPVQPLVMFFGGAATLTGLAFEPLGQVLGWGAYPWLTWTIRVVGRTAGFPHASFPLALSDLGLVAVYGVIGGLTAGMLVSVERRRAFWESVRARLPLKAAMGGTALVTLVAWFAILQFPDDKLKVAFLDVGQGDAIFIETPGGAQILIDGGPVGSTLLSQLGRQMPFWDRTLDLVVLTHPDADHLTGLVSALERYSVGAVVVREQLGAGDLANAWETALAAKRATLLPGEAGTRIELSDGVVLDVLHPGPDLVAAGDDNTNNESIVVRMVYKDVAFLLPGDIEAEVEKELARSGVYLHSTVLKVPHHGSNTSSCQAFLDAVSPQVAVISVGVNNDFGHPSGEVLERMEGTPHVFRTDKNGTVMVTSDGQRLWIETER